MTPDPDFDLREETEADRVFLEGLHRAAVLQAMGMAEDDADPATRSLVEIQLRARAVGHAADWPGARRRTAWIGPERVGSLITSPGPDSLHVVDIAVAGSRRRRGVGRAMLAAVIHEAEQAGVDATARILVSNTASLALFAAAGFAREDHQGPVQVTVRWSPITNM